MKHAGLSSFSMKSHLANEFFLHDCVCVRACVRECVRMACVRVCVYVCVLISAYYVICVNYRDCITRLTVMGTK